MKIIVILTPRERRDIKRLLKWRLNCIRNKMQDLDLDPYVDDKYYQSLQHEHDTTCMIASRLLKEQL